MKNSIVIEIMNKLRKFATENDLCLESILVNFELKEGHLVATLSKRWVVEFDNPKEI